MSGCVRLNHHHGFIVKIKSVRVTFIVRLQMNETLLSSLCVITVAELSPDTHTLSSWLFIHIFFLFHPSFLELRSGKAPRRVEWCIVGVSPQYACWPLQWWRGVSGGGCWVCGPPLDAGFACSQSVTIMVKDRKEHIALPPILHSFLLLLLLLFFLLSPIYIFLVCLSFSQFTPV